MMHLPVFDQAGRWTGQWSSRAMKPYTTPTLASLRAPSHYYVISDAQLKRDLKGRTLADVYRENRALRDVEHRYKPRRIKIVTRTVRKGSGKYAYVTEQISAGGLGISRLSPAEEYLAWCKERGHTPHPASIDPDHPQNTHRLKTPKRESC